MSKKKPAASKKKSFDVEMRIQSEHFVTVSLVAKNEEDAQKKALKIPLKKRLKWQDAGFDWQSLIVMDVQESDG